MSVKVDKSGRRSIEVEVEVPGTPEEVWQAIATGRGVSSWFVPTEITEQQGGVVTSNFGPGMEGQATITDWEPPRRFSAESDGLGPGAPALATEWHVEARSGGICTVRVVHSLFTDSDEWDNQLESIESGWPVFFETLRLYVAHFRGQACSNIQLVEVSSQSKSEAWDSMIEGLGFHCGQGRRFVENSVWHAVGIREDSQNRREQRSSLCAGAGGSTFPGNHFADHCRCRRPGLRATEPLLLR